MDDDDDDDDDHRLTYHDWMSSHPLHPYQQYSHDKYNEMDNQYTNANSQYQMIHHGLRYPVDSTAHWTLIQHFPTGIDDIEQCWKVLVTNKGFVIDVVMLLLL